MNSSEHPFNPEEVMAFVDGELSAERARVVSTHIEQCGDCASRVMKLRTLSSQVASWQVETVPKTLPVPAAAAAAEKSANQDPRLRRLLTPRRSSLLSLSLKVASVFAGVLLVFVLAVPNLLRSRMAANEASAVGSLRTLNTAAVAYYQSYGHYPPSLRSFGGDAGGVATEDAAGLIDNVLAQGGPKAGYLFAYHRGLLGSHENQWGYTINAEPLEPGKGGQRHFSTDQTGTIFADGVELGGPSAPIAAKEHLETENRITDSSPLISRKARLEMVVAKLDDARQAMERILTQHHGHIAELSASAESNSLRTMRASLRVPSDHLEVCLAELKKLGRVTQESQTGEEVTRQHADLVARLKNSRNTETRLNDVIQQHAGQVKDVLEVEKESARVRGEIEQMEAEQTTLEHRVEFATIDLKLMEEYKAQLTSPAPSAVMQLRNASVNGFRNASENLLGILIFLAESGPTLLLWLLILFFPVRLIWRRYQRSMAVVSR